jgi:DNA-binding transcriptional regulator YiaG
MSEILDIAHDMGRDLFKAGAMDEITMRQVKALCLEKFRVSSFKFQVRGAGLRARQSRVRTAHH